MKAILSNWPMLIVFVGAILSAIGAALLTVRQSGRSEEMIALMKENAGFAKEIAALTKENAALLTGGDSYCYLNPVFSGRAGPTRRGRAEILVSHRGKYPLYDVQIRVVDLQKFRQIMDDPSLSVPIPEEKLAPAERMYGPISRLDPGFIKPVGAWKLPESADEQDYNVFITAHNSAHNGMLTQFIRFRGVEGRWHRALQVLRGTEILEEQGAEWLSKDETGRPKWD